MPVQDRHEQLSCLGLTSQQAIAAAKSAFRVPTNVAMDAYRRIFREGVRSIGPWRLDLPELSRVLREDSNEGEVIKFVCGVPPVAEAGGAKEEPGDRSGPRSISLTPLVRRSGLRDGALETESVLIPMMGSSGARTYTLCVSSQVGCAMGCTFCETAQMGLIRSLTASEIVAQWYNAAHVLGVRPKNVVFMGMGEPLDNFDHVMQAVAVLKDHNGAAVPVSNITVSTVGRIDGLRKMRERIAEPGWHRLNLALSLNAPDDQVRSEIMPINRKWSMAELQAELVDWPRYAGNKLCIEYVLIPGVNDAREHAAKVADFMRPLVAHVRNGASGDPAKDTRVRAVLNLIPYNPRRNSPWPAPTEEGVCRFADWLIEERVFVKRRRTKGRRMMGACGQLGNELIRQRKRVEAAGR